MRRRTILAVGLAAMATISLIMPAVPAPMASKEATLITMFKAEYNARDAAYSAKNVDKYLSFFTDDYANYGADGRVRCSTKQQLHDIMVLYNQHHAKVPSPYEVIQTVQPTDGGMVVTLAGRQGIRHRDFWVKRHGTWLIKQYRSLG